LEAEAPRARRKLAAIVMIDVSGFSRLMERDEEWTTREIRAFHARVATRVGEHEGRVVDTAGDSVFAEFDSVVHATRCAQAVQDDQLEANRNQPLERRIDTRIGVHVGDVIVEEYKVYGDGVNIAARLEALAEPGHILVSEAVYQQVHNKIVAEFRDEGFRTLKNIEQPVRVYSLVPSAVVAAGDQRASIRPPTRREERLSRRTRSQPRPSGSGREADPARERLEPEPEARSFFDSLLRPDIATPLAIGVALNASDLFKVPSGGVLPTAGAILIGLSLGRALDRGRRRGFIFTGLGIGILCGAQYTHWSSVTDLMFVLGGVIVMIQGFGMRRRARSLRRRRG
jgi:class 3 adenylate cyclase